MPTNIQLPYIIGAVVVWDSTWLIVGFLFLNTQHKSRPSPVNTRSVFHCTCSRWRLNTYFFFATGLSSQALWGTFLIAVERGTGLPLILPKIRSSECTSGILSVSGGVAVPVAVLAAGLGLQNNWMLSPVAQDLSPALQVFLFFFLRRYYWALSFLHPQVKEYFISLYFNKEIQSTQQVLSRVCQGRRKWVGGYCSPSLALSFKCSLLQESNTLLLEVNTLQDFPNWHIKQLSFKCYEKGIKSSKTETTSPHLINMKQARQRLLKH